MYNNLRRKNDGEALGAMNKRCHVIEVGDKRRKVDAHFLKIENVCNQE